MNSKFHKFDFRYNSQDELTFIKRAKRELTGEYAPDSFLNMIYAGYWAFIVENALRIVASKKTPEQGRFNARLTPAPLVDEMWCLAILYSKKYKELCEYLCGGVIERTPRNKIEGFQYFKKIWPDYDLALYELDQFFTVWILDKDVARYFTYFFNMMQKKAVESVIHFKKNQLERELIMYHETMTPEPKDIGSDRYELNTPDSHSYFSKDSESTPNEIFDKISKNLPTTLSLLFSKKYSKGPRLRCISQSMQGS